MAKIIVAIDVGGVAGDNSKAALDAHIQANRGDWFPKDTYIAIDESYLERDEEDDSFFAFEFRGTED